MSLYDKLIEYKSSDILPMHMPGHKRQQFFGGELPYGIDITEIEGFDNLHHREGILKELSERMSILKGAAYAVPLVNGSTAGIIASVMALTKPGDTVIMTRGCHKSVYHAAEICRLNTKYIYPDCDKNDGYFLSIAPKDVEKAFFDNSNISLVIITSPTYEGIASDIKEISNIAHRHGAKLLVDAAHGAHLGFSSFFPNDAISLGADAVVESLHKTLPAMTQCAALYLNKNINPKPFEKALGKIETSSPSYVLMASIDKCISILENRSDEIFEQFNDNLNYFDSKISSIKNLTVPFHKDFSDYKSYDRSKIIISSAGTNLTGSDVAKLLRKKFRIEPEMICSTYVLCMSSICDTKENFERLAEAVIEIDKLASRDFKDKKILSYPKTRQILTLDEANNSGGEYISLKKAEGRISHTYLWAYPPGIPILAPGEIITREIIDYINSLIEDKIDIQQEGEPNCDEIFVCKCEKSI